MAIYRYPQIFAFLRNDSHVSEIEKDYVFTSNSGGLFFSGRFIFFSAGVFFFPNTLYNKLPRRKGNSPGEDAGQERGAKRNFVLSPGSYSPKVILQNKKRLIYPLCGMLWCRNGTKTNRDLIFLKWKNKSKKICSTKLKNQKERNEKIILSHVPFLMFSGPLRHW